MIQCYNYDDGKFISTIGHVKELQDKLQTLQKQCVIVNTQDDMSINYKISDKIRNEIEKFEIENKFDVQPFPVIKVSGMQIIPNRINISYLVKIWSFENIETSVLIVVNDFPNLCKLINNDLKFLINSEIAENISDIELTVD